MTRFPISRGATPLAILVAWAATLLVAGGAVAAAPRIDEKQLLDAGFKVLVPTTKVQEDWVRGLTPGKIRPMQRTGRKFYVSPDATRTRLYVGGPKEFEAFVKSHPEHRPANAGQTARAASAYRSGQDDAMRKATARDLSDPFLGASWADLGW